MSTLIHKLLIIYTKSFSCPVCSFFSIRNTLEGNLSNQPDSDVFPVCHAIKTPCSAFLFCEICPSSYLNLWFMLWNWQKVCAAGLCSALITPNLSDLYPKTSNIGLSAVGALGDYFNQRHKLMSPMKHTAETLHCNIVRLGAGQTMHHQC